MTDTNNNEIITNTSQNRLNPRNSNNSSSEQDEISTNDAIRHSPEIYSSTKDRLNKMGWFLPDTTLKQRMFVRGKFLHCYVCDECISFNQVGASRTIPRNMMTNYNPITGEEPTKSMENIVILCLRCVIDDVIVEAPRSYASMLNYNKRNTSWYNTQIKIKMDMEADKMVLMEGIYDLQSNLELLRMEHNKLKQDIIDLNGNLSLDRAKYKKLRSIQSMNKSICTNITEDGKRMLEHIKQVSNKCKNNLAKTQERINMWYEELSEKNRENVEDIESQFTMEISNEAPCQICKTAKLSIFLDPCGHCVCKRCKEGVINSGDQCPYCRASISNYKSLYLGF